MWAGGPGHWRETPAFKLLFLPEMDSSRDPHHYWSPCHWLSDLQIPLPPSPSSPCTACLVSLSILSWMFTWPWACSLIDSIPSCHYHLSSLSHLILLLKFWIWGGKIKLEGWEWELEDPWRQECFILSSQKQNVEKLLFFCFFWAFHIWLGGLICFPTQAALLSNLA